MYSNPCYTINPATKPVTKPVELNGFAIIVIAVIAVIVIALLGLQLPLRFVFSLRLQLIQLLI